MKLLGIALVLTFSMLFGASLAEKENKRRRIDKEILSFLEYLADGVSKGVPLNRIAQNYGGFNDNELKTQLVNVFFRCENKSEETEISGELAAITKELLTNLATSPNPRSAHESCLSCLKRAQEIYAKNKEEGDRKKELYSKLCIMCGIALCIVVI